MSDGKKMTSEIKGSVVDDAALEAVNGGHAEPARMKTDKLVPDTAEMFESKLTSAAKRYQ